MQVRFRRFSAAIGFGIVVLWVGAAPAQVVETAVWSGTTGNWNNPNIWTTSPDVGLFPNNGQPTGATTYNAQVAGSGIITLNVPIIIDQLAFQSGTISGPSAGSNSLTVNTALTWGGGTFIGNETIVANGGATFPGGAGPNLDTATLNIGGTSSSWSGGNITIQNGATLNNAAGSTLTASAGGAIAVGPGGTAPTFNNSGAFVKTGGGTTTAVAAPVTNGGTFEAAGGVLQTTGTFTNSGTLLAAGGSLQINGPLSNLSGGVLTGGVYQVMANSSLNLNGPVTTIGASTTVELDGTNSNFASINSIAAVNGTFRLTNGQTFTTAGDLAVGSTAAPTGGTLDVQSGSTLNVSGNLSVPSPASILNGTVNVSGTTSVTSTLSVGLGAKLGGAQLLTVGAGGALVVQGTVTQPTTVDANGRLSGNATLTNNLTILAGGHVAPGNSPGTIVVGGNMTLNGAYDWDLAGNDNLMAGTTFDQIQVAGTALLDPPVVNVQFDATGTLNFADPFWAQPRTWLILSASALDEVAAPTLTTSDNSFQAFYPEGSFSTELQGTSGLLVAWNPTAVPEPGSIVLTALGLACAGWAARRKHETAKPGLAR